MATEAQLAREWAGVAGACFALMGAGLAGRAKRHAEENVVWQKQWRQAVGAAPADRAADEAAGRRLAWTYRAAGAAFAAGGLSLLGAALARPDVLAWRPASIGPGGALAGGLALSCIGVGMAWSKASAIEPAPLGGLPAPARPVGERVAHASGWALSFVLSGYGLRLLREALR